ncbi:RNA polymerase sigma factor [Nocardia salmonicida]|uniref:RNA polymerase sigma factor n=1 Tax=Nocardia salmonicida TaxID=53431 RepID=UPI003717FCFC
MNAGWSAEDRECLRKFYETHRQFVFAQLLMLLRGDVADAQDLCHDVFEKVLQKYDVERLNAMGEKQQRALLYRILHNRAIDEFRRESRLSMLHVAQVEDALPPVRHPKAENAFDRIEVELLLQRFFALAEHELSRREYEVALLGWYFERTDPEIAEILQTTQTTVRTLRSRALKKIKTFVNRDGHEIVFPADSRESSTSTTVTGEETA